MLFGAIFCAGGMVAAVMVLFPAWESWSARSWVPVQAHVISTNLDMSNARRSGNSRSAGTAAYRVNAEYAYRYGGRHYTSTNTGGGGGADNFSSFHHDLYRRLSAAHATRTTITAYVDPVQPQHATLSRAFRWESALFALLFWAVLAAIGVAAFTLPARGWRVPAKGPLVAPDHGTYLFTALYALWWNLLAFPLALLAVAGMAHGARLAHVAALVFFAAGLALAAKAWRLYEQRWLLGAPLLERLHDGSGRFMVRFHFHPGLGMRLAPGPSSHRVGVEVRQLQHKEQAHKSSVSVVWQQDLGERDVAHGAATLDIAPLDQAWRNATDTESPAYWEVGLRALGNTLVFRVEL